MASSSAGQASGVLTGDASNDTFAGSSYDMGDPRNPRIDTLINTRTQQSVSPTAFNNPSPVSLDYHFTYTGSPHESSNSGIDAPPDLRMGHSQGFPARNSMSDLSRRNPLNMTSQQPQQHHRASMTSIESGFETELLNTTTNNHWPPSNSSNPALSNSDGSPRKSGHVVGQEKKSKDEEKPPAWSELKTKAGKERKRLPLACIACRRKKIRCSGEKPACKHCLRACVPCVYKVTTRKAAPRTDYMAMLDKRLKRMEDRVIRVVPKEELPDPSTTGRSSVRPPIPGQSPKKERNVPTKKRSADEAFTRELSDWTQSRQQSTLLDQNAGLSKQRDGENKLFSEGSESLPPQHIQEHLAEVFFDSVYGQSYLLLHKPSFMRKLKAGNVPPVLILAVCAISARFSTHPQVNGEPAFLRGEQWATPARRIAEKRHFEPNITILIVMLILGLHYFGTCEGGLSWSLGGQAMRMGYALQLHRDLEHDPLGREQIGKSSKQTKSNVKPPELSFTDREIRRRTMWACYLMDTFNSSGTERPSFLSEDYFQIQLPIRESYFQMEVPGPTEDLHGTVPTTTQKSFNSSDELQLANEARNNMGVAAYVIRAVVIWKRIVRYWNLGGKEKDPHPIWDPLSEFAALQRQITQLKASLPKHIAYNSENLATYVSERLANQYLFLHIVLAQTSLFLHRFAVPTQPSTRPHHHANLASGMPKKFLTASARIVIESAASISQLVADSLGHTLTVPFAGYCVYASATVHVWGIFSKNASLEASSKEHLRHNYKYLIRMRQYWGMFYYMVESVKEIYRAFADASLKPPTAAVMAATAATLLRKAGSASASGEDSVNVDDKSEGGSVSGLQTPMHLSPAGSPTTAVVETTNSVSSITTVVGPDDKASRGSTGSMNSTKVMFQYGDWFDKYPHGVSDVEWETNHLEFKKEGEDGNEAVMSQRPELRSVEEFFASLSPPSKAEEQQQQQQQQQQKNDTATARTKKVPRRRGKSVAENKRGGNGGSGNATAVGAGAENLPNQKQSQDQIHNHVHAHRSYSQSQHGSGASHPSFQRHMSSSSVGLSPTERSVSAQQQQQQQQQQHLHHQQSFSSQDFDMTSPSTVYQSSHFQQAQQQRQQPQQPTSFDFGQNSPHINFNSTSGLHQLDRQMVFDAYANVDPGVSMSKVGAINNLSSPHHYIAPNNNSWDPIDFNDFQFNPAYGAGDGGGMVGSNTGTAWFMPFNMDPPNFGSGGLEMEEFGGNALDGMDLSSMGGAGDARNDIPGSYAAPGHVTKTVGQP